MEQFAISAAWQRCRCQIYFLTPDTFSDNVYTVIRRRYVIQEFVILAP